MDGRVPGEAGLLEPGPSTFGTRRGRSLNPHGLHLAAAPIESESGDKADIEAEYGERDSKRSVPECLVRDHGPGHDADDDKYAQNDGHPCTHPEAKGDADHAKEQELKHFANFRLRNAGQRYRLLVAKLRRPHLARRDVGLDGRKTRREGPQVLLGHLLSFQGQRPAPHRFDVTAPQTVGHTATEMTDM
jgi:hypothetical protein